MEPEVTVRCRGADAEITRFAAERVAQKYEERMHEAIKISVSEDYLPESRYDCVRAHLICQNLQC